MVAEKYAENRLINQWLFPNCNRFEYSSSCPYHNWLLERRPLPGQQSPTADHHTYSVLQGLVSTGEKKMLSATGSSFREFLQLKMTEDDPGYWSWRSECGDFGASLPRSSRHKHVICEHQKDGATQFLPAIFFPHSHHVLLRRQS